MKKVLLLLLLGPLHVWAQQDRIPPPVSAENLKPIESDLVPAYNSRYGTSMRTQYMYDGLDVRHAKDLGPYILASNNPDAIREFNSYLTSRHAGGWLIGGGLIASGVGLIVGISNDHSGEANKGPYSSTGVVSNGTICYGYCNSVPDRTNQAAVKAGVTTLFSGLIVAAIGAYMLRPGPHLRRSVQYYNRSLKQQGISWQLTPYSSLSNSGVGLVGRF
ncbi:hypothetical protein GO755_24505 [Spirosoma sp. HMF4905]|uniref:Uncharacterized protein n=1 Tax=Spirosoma arboris TaxID=2682092 RepID=A0A7K1SHE3_9BACT|nr:hypothetical protein [Spirosoma arboris]MVM33225.1 hypothetical protein [Spirosoma arboris]